MNGEILSSAALLSIAPAFAMALAVWVLMAVCGDSDELFS
jgi:hypothetical protein